MVVSLRTWTLLTVLALLTACSGRSRQVPDLEYRPRVGAPSFESGQGPTVLVDEAHFNFHTANGRYRPFAELLRRDGYVVEPLSVRVTGNALARGDILVISNAIAEENRDTWKLPNPSAFDASEITATERWVDAGGSLLLIADHMPFPGAAEDLAASFGLLFNNGYARARDRDDGTMTFLRSDGSLGDHPITRGHTSAERIESVRTFTGQAFRPSPDVSVEPLLVLGDDAVLLMPEEAWQFSDRTPRVAAAGWLQGAVLRHGSGRVAAFGEAAMFSAQLSGETERPMGMNHPEASENAQFLLNVMHWLCGLLPEE